MILTTLLQAIPVIDLAPRMPPEGRKTKRTVTTAEDPDGPAATCSVVVHTTGRTCPFEQDHS